MPQDPDHEEELDEQQGTASSELVSLYQGQIVDAEIEADVIRGVLDSNGIPSILVRTPYPSLGFEVKVPNWYLEEARRLLEEAKAAGPEAAAEAEQAGEDENRK